MELCSVCRKMFTQPSFFLLMFNCFVGVLFILQFNLYHFVVISCYGFFSTILLLLFRLPRHICLIGRYMIKSLTKCKNCHKQHSKNRSVILSLFYMKFPWKIFILLLILSITDFDNKMECSILVHDL